MGWQDAPAVPRWQQAPSDSKRTRIPDAVLRKVVTPPFLSSLTPEQSALFQNGALAGFGDRIRAAFSAITGGDYGQALARERQTISDARKTGGTSAKIAEAAGGSLPFLLAGSPSSLFTKGAPLLSKAASAGRALAPTAAIGGLMGASETKDLRNVSDLSRNIRGGAVQSVAGDLAGRGIAKGLGAVLAPKLATKAPVTGSGYKAGVQLLANEGVDIMPGQAIGPGMKALEEKAMSAPLVGDAIRRRALQQQGQLNRAGINRALRPLGVTLPAGKSGADAMGFMQKSFDDAYDAARSGMVFQADANFTSNVDDLLARAQNSPLLSQDHVNRLARVVDDLRKRRISPDGAMSGDVYKKTLSSLKADAAKLMAGNNSADNQALGGYMRELVDHIDEAARSNPMSDPAAVALMDKADEGYAMAVRIEDAARRRGGEPGTFTANQLDAAVQKADKSARSRAYLRGDALMQDLSSAARNVMAPSVPDSGTAGRMLLNGAVLGGGAYISPASLAAAGLASAPYLVPGLLTRRPDIALRAGQGARKIAAPAGAFGAGFLAGGN